MVLVKLFSHHFDRLLLAHSFVRSFVRSIDRPTVVRVSVCGSFPFIYFVPSEEKINSIRKYWAPKEFFFSTFPLFSILLLFAKRYKYMLHYFLFSAKCYNKSTQRKRSLFFFVRIVCVLSCVVLKWVSYVEWYEKMNGGAYHLLDNPNVIRWLV